MANEETGRRVPYLGDLSAELAKALAEDPAGMRTALGLGVTRSMGRRKVGFIGDSITAGNDTYKADAIGGAENNDAPSTYAMLASRGQWEMVQNAGVPGETSTSILARLKPQVIDVGCDICVIYSCSQNDYSQSVSIAQSMINVTAMLDTCITNNVLPVLCTPTPDQVTGGSSARKAAMSQRRRLFIDLARIYGVPIVDLMPLLVDPATGVMAAAYSAGDIHPNSAGRQVGGAAVAAVLDRILPGTGASDVTHAADPDDLLLGYGFFAADTNSDGVGDGWSANTVSGATPSIYTDPVLGKVQRVTTTATASSFQIQRGITVIPGHVYEISGYVSKNGTSQMQFSLNPTSGGNRRLTVTGSMPDITRGHFSLRYIPTAGNSSANFYLIAGAGTGTVDFGRVAVRDLTLLGLT